MPAERAPGARGRPRTPRELRRYIPELGEVRTEIDRRVKVLMEALAEPTTLMAALRAVRALRQAVEVGAREGPRDPRVRAAVHEAETASLTALREALGSLLAGLAALPPGPSGGTEGGGTGAGELVEVPVERTPPRRAARARGGRRGARAPPRRRRPH